MSLRPIFLLLFPIICFANEVAFTEPKRVTQTEMEQLLIPDLKGIVLLSSNDKLIEGVELKEKIGVDCGTVDLPGPCSKLAQRLQLFLNRPLALKNIYEIKKAITSFYQEYSHPLVVIDVPTQNISYSVLQFVVTQSRLGEVKVEGNRKWSNLDQVKSFIQIKPNEYINDRVLTKDLNFLNQGQFRQVDAIYEPGKEQGTTDLLLLVQDVRPYQFYIGTDNSGIKSTISTLYYAGATYGNLFGLGHSLSYQYTTSNFHAMQAHTAQYLAPLPNLHVLNLYGGYAQVFPTNESPFVENNSGYAIQASVRYSIPFLPTVGLRHEITAGFDYKRTNTDQIFSSSAALAPFHSTVNLTQFMCGYDGSYRSSEFMLVFLGELYFSPFEWIAQQSNSDFSNLSPGATHKWIYGRGAFIYYQKLPRSFYLNLSVRGQSSTNSLLPSEQFGLGGYDTVRGYNERILNYDSAILLSGEIHTPTWKIIQRISKNSLLNDQLQLLAFIDYGWGSNHTPVPGEPKSDFLAGIGPGLRYALENYLTCRFDLGFKLHKSAVIGTSLCYLHFSVTGSY